jgi:hypothetical protein
MNWTIGEALTGHSTVDIIMISFFGMGGICHGPSTG